VSGQNGANGSKQALGPSFVQSVYETAVLYYGEYDNLCDLELLSLQKDCQVLGAGSFLEGDTVGAAFYLAKLETLGRELDARSITGDLNDV